MIPPIFMRLITWITNTEKWKFILLLVLILMKDTLPMDQILVPLHAHLDNIKENIFAKIALVGVLVVAPLANVQLAKILIYLMEIYVWEVGPSLVVV